MELQHYAPEVISRINTHLGTQAVRTIRFVQTLPPAGVSNPAPPAATPAWAVAGAEAAVAELPAGELREALAALGRAVLAATAVDNGASTS